MRVVATKKFKTYYEGVCVDVADGEEVSGPFAAFLDTSGCPVRVLDADASEGDNGETPDPAKPAAGTEPHGTGETGDSPEPHPGTGAEPVPPEIHEPQPKRAPEPDPVPGSGMEPDPAPDTTALTGAPGPQPADPSVVDPATAGLDINGTAAQVLDWVGDDEERARAAHEAETGRDKPRKTLLSKLEEIAGG